VVNSVGAGIALLAHSLDGEPFKESGPLQLVSTGERRNDRSVRQLQSIRVLTEDLGGFLPSLSFLRRHVQRLLHRALNEGADARAG
jgi:hypothetical protein